ncbi:MAG: hypothetical protein AAFR35_16180 [Pseudomonadota bacterium]
MMYTTPDLSPERLAEIELEARRMRAKAMAEGVLAAARWTARVFEFRRDRTS